MKAVVQKIFENSEDINLFALKFHIRDHFEEDKSRIGRLNYLHTSTYEFSSLILKTFRRMCLMRN